MKIIIVSLLESHYRAFYNSLKKETKVLRTCVTGRKTEAVESGSVSTSPALQCSHRPPIPPSPLFSSFDTSTLFVTIPRGVDPLYLCMATDSFLRQGALTQTLPHDAAWIRLPRAVATC